jgi:hypothetical protein
MTRRPQRAEYFPEQSLAPYLRTSVVNSSGGGTTIPLAAGDAHDSRRRSGQSQS